MSKKVSRTVNTRRNRDDVARKQTYVFDFEGVTEEELIELATKQLVIDVQAKARKAKTDKEFAQWDHKETSVREMLDATPQRKTKEEKAIELVMETAGLDRETAENLIYRRNA